MESTSHDVLVLKTVITQAIIAYYQPVSHMNRKSHYDFEKFISKSGNVTKIVIGFLFPVHTIIAVNELLFVCFYLPYFFLRNSL